MIKKTKYCQDDNSQIVCTFAILIKIQATFVKINKWVLKFTLKNEMGKNSQDNLAKKQNWSVCLSDIKVALKPQ